MGQENTLEYNFEPLKSFNDIRRFYSNLVKILLAKDLYHLTATTSTLPVCVLAKTLKVHSIYTAIVS